MSAIVLVILVVAVVVGVAYICHVRNAAHPANVLGQIGSYQVTKQASAAIVTSYGHLTQKQATTALLDEKLAEDMGQDYGIQVSTIDVTAALTARGTTTQKAGAYIQLTTRTQLLNQKLAAAVKGYATGQIVLAGFPKYIYIKGAGLPPDERSLTPQDFSRLYSQTKQAATTYINKLHQQVTSGKLTFAQAVATASNDPQYGTAANLASLQSGSFNTSNTTSVIQPVTTQKSFSSQITSLRPGQVSSLFYITESNSATGKGGQQVDAYAAMIKLQTKVTPIGKYSSFAAMQAAYKHKLNYRVFQ